MTDAGQQAWEAASPYARERARSHAVTSGTNTARLGRGVDGRRARQPPMMQKTRPRALAFLIAAGAGSVDIAIIAYSVINRDLIMLRDLRRRVADHAVPACCRDSRSAR